LWKDLTLQNSVSVPLPKPPPVPSVVEFPSDSDEFDDDDVSTLYYPQGSSFSTGRRGLQVEVLEFELEEEDDEHEDGPLTCKYPRPKPVSRFFHNDCDGSSYSSCKKTTTTGRSLRRHALTWQTNSTDTTMQTQNHSIRSFQRAH
jgi:hypothetical protein